MKKHLFIMSFLLLIAGFLAACGSDENNEQEASTGGNDQDEEVTISFWDENAGPTRTPLWEELIARFEEENPNINVEYSGLPAGDAKSKFDTAIATEDMPDVGSIQTRWLPEFAIRDALLSLDEFFEKFEINELINDQAIQFNQDIVQDEKLYGIPYTQNLDIFYIRSDWFEEEGVDAPETWDNFFAAAQTLTNEERYGYTIRGGDGGAFPLQTLMFAYSGNENYFDEGGNSVINDPKHVEFVEKYLGLYKEYTPESDITNASEELIVTFDSGTAAMMHHNLGSYQMHADALEEDQFEVIPAPKVDDGDHYVVEGGNTVNTAIFKTTEHPEAAWKFVEFVNSAESQSYWNEQAGQIPTNAAVKEDDWVKEAEHINTGFEVYEDPSTVLYQPPFYLPDYNDIMQNTVVPDMQRVLNGEKTAQELLDTWASVVNESENKYREAFE